MRRSPPQMPHDSSPASELDARGRGGGSLIQRGYSTIQAGTTDACLALESSEARLHAGKPSKPHRRRAHRDRNRGAGRGNLGNGALPLLLGAHRSTWPSPWFNVDRSVSQRPCAADRPYALGGRAQELILDTPDMSLEIAMNFPLTNDEARFLVRHLTHWTEHLDSDLVHTDRRDLQRSLAGELATLRALTDRLRSMTEQETEQETTPDFV